MPDLAKISLSSSSSPDSSLFPVKIICDWERTPVSGGGGDGDGNSNTVPKRNRVKKGGCNAEGSDSLDGSLLEAKVELCVSPSKSFLPFLVRAKKMIQCLQCHLFINPGEELLCSVHDCQGVYHLKCAKERLGITNLKKFKCPQHTCFLCKQKSQWRCVRCQIAAHDKCAPWPEEVIRLVDQPGRVVCWRHPADWQLDKKNMAPTSNIEEIFGLLPLPYVNEEFKVDLTWKGLADDKLEPPPYVHIRRNVYLIKKKRKDADVGCTSCKSSCGEDCVCRVQCISCSRACRCPESCTNRPFHKEKKIKVVKTELCGWGVEAAEPIDKGEFIVEYIGEVIDDALCERRLWDMKYKVVNNFYMCEIGKDFTIDATFKGNASRFLNHSCAPNCVLEKWQVVGETRVGVFAARSIRCGEPLTYDYRFVQFGPEVKCCCGAANCQGFLGTRKKICKVKFIWGAKQKRSRRRSRR
ncbi:hypothetical protein K2173_015846 [Erythroxylum novogranatense]|uniref:Uncharacterized protein n=1 Tax=Erythroxylum novogranatense TaxID=1862640 RepID=A0AAV8SF50_9ROSI|nr:hypothetical protein K2173_015846 [Erythroxylum novogranatense]